MRSIILFALLILLNNTLYAQGNSSNRGGGQGYSRLYNPNTVVKVEGIVKDIQTIAHDGSNGSGIHIKLQTRDKTIEVHLGPSWYVNKQDVKLHIQDKVTVTGSEVLYNGAKVIIASRIEVGSKVLELRDANGLPMWSGIGVR